MRSPFQIKERSEEKENDYLNFILDKKSYAFRVEDVKEVLSPKQIQEKQDNTVPDHLITIRDEVLPFLDTSKYFLIKKKTDLQKESRLIVLQAAHQKSVILVDEVPDVLKINPDKIQKEKNLHSDHPLYDLTLGYYKDENTYFTLLDCKKLLKSGL